MAVVGSKHVGLVCVVTLVQVDFEGVPAACVVWVFVVQVDVHACRILVEVLRVCVVLVVGYPTAHL